MVNTIIKYNNKTIPFPTPLVSLERENLYYNQYWGNSDKIVLNGQISGINNCSPFASITSGQNNLLNIFNQNFGNFEIYEATGATGFNFNLTADAPINPSIQPYYTGISGAYIPKNSNLILRIDGSYGGYAIVWEKSKNKINWESFTLYKTNYYSGSPFPYVRFDPNRLYPQVFPYLNYPMTATPSQNNIGNQNDPNINGRGIYTGNIGDYNYFRLAIIGGGGGSPAGNLIASGFDAEKIYENSGIIVRSINFNESNYAGLIDYTIELNSIRPSGNIIDPTNEYSFTENENKTVSLSHNVSAKGINTSLNPSKSNAIDNAISFVRSNTGLANVPTTKFISGSSSKFYLQNFSESIDRLNNVYSVQETYLSNLLNTGSSGNLTYTSDITSGADSNIVQINLRGQYKGPKNGNINDLRNSLNVTGLLSGIYSGYYNRIPIQYNVTENTGENLINFDYSFDNLNLPNPYFKYDSNISRDEIQQIYNIQVRGDIIARGNRAYRYFLSTGNLTNLTGQLLSVASGILTGFKDFNGDTVSSNLRLLNISIDQNPNNGTVSANASYDDRFMPTGNFVDATYNVSVEAPRWYMNNQPTCNIKGYHIINDFDITTLPKLNINTTFKAKDVIGTSTESGLRQLAATLTNNLAPTNYNYNTQLNATESYNKKYNNMTSLSEISYKLDKIDISNQDALLPKFNTIT